MGDTYAGDPTQFPATIIIPSDGDVEDDASVVAGMKQLADRTAHLGKLRALQVKTFGVDDASSAHAQIGVNITSDTFVAVTGGAQIAFSNVKAGDLVVLACSAWANMTGVAQSGALRLYDANNAVGINHSIPEVRDRVEGSVGAMSAHTLVAFYTVLSDAGSLQIILQGRRGDAAALQVRAPLSLVGTLYRSF